MDDFDPKTSPMREDILNVLRVPEITRVRRTPGEGWELLVGESWQLVTFLPTHWVLNDLLASSVIRLDDQRLAHLVD